ncbi:MAG: four-carbon acid sugar kinase family protein [Firmicutes bacterium]|nr:four-carbon acid sugar kinase family protein [Bacillota bacterium]
MIGVVADDMTGAHDTGSMFVKSGALVYVFSYGNGREELAIDQGELPDVLILDTDSRFDPPDVAYAKVRRAAKTLWELGYRRFYKKICSAFRGNIGSELDGMLDALGEDFAGVVAGFPKNGRQTIEGIHYIHGAKLEDSEFRFDPVHPMTSSNLVDLLQKQTERKVALLDHTTIEQGAAYLGAAAEQLRSEYSYVILDVVDQNSLKTIAEALHHLPVLGASSALAEELLSLPSNRDVQATIALPKQAGIGVLCAAGSLMPQTAAQVEAMRQGCAPVLELESRKMLEPAKRVEAIKELSQRIADLLVRGENVVVHTSNNPEVVAQTKALGQSRGLSTIAVSRLISEALAEVVNNCVEGLGLNRLIVAGGDTSAAVCSRLGVAGMRIWQEIAPGIPSCISLTGPPLFLVLKPGGFGKPDFFSQAVAHLQGKSE